MPEELNIGQEQRITVSQIRENTPGMTFVQIVLRPTYDIDADWLDAEECRALIAWLQSALGETA